MKFFLMFLSFLIVACDSPPDDKVIKTEYNVPFKLLHFDSLHNRINVEQLDNGMIWEKMYIDGFCKTKSELPVNSIWYFDVKTYESQKNGKKYLKLSNYKDLCRRSQKYGVFYVNPYQD